MTLLQRLSGSLAQTLRLTGRQFQQGAAFHLSATVDARRKDAAASSSSSSDSDSDAEDGNPKSARRTAARRRAVAEVSDSPPADSAPGSSSSAGSAAGAEEGPAGAAAAANDADEVDAGRYDVTTLISPALAAALEAAPEGGEEVVEGVMQQLNDAVERLERGQGLKGDGPASLDDLRQVAEAIDLYFQAVPEAGEEGEEEEGDGVLEEFDRDLLQALGETLHEVLDGGARTTTINTAPPGRLPWEVIDVEEEVPMLNWGVDLTEGRAGDPWKNALLSEEAKEAMWGLHSKQGWPAERLAEHFGIRKQRAMAILALKEQEHAAAAAGAPLHAELAAGMEEALAAHEVMGASERHHVVLPSFPNYKELTEADAEKLAALLEARLGKRFADIELEDMTAEVTQELLAAAGMDKGALEEELASREEQHLVAEFRRNLEYNLGKSGTTLSRSSRKLHPPQRPQEGWGLRVTPLGKAAAPRQPYVAAPDGSQRELTADEQLMMERQQPRPRSKIL